MVGAMSEVGSKRAGALDGRGLAVHVAGGLEPLAYIFDGCTERWLSV
jgi:hypothetical protein